MSTLVFFQSAIACDCKGIKVPEDPNLDQKGQAEAYKYSFSPESKKEFRARVAEAKQFCAKYKKEHPDEKLAVVSDIDETILDNRGCAKGADHSDWSEWSKWVQESKAPRLKESAAFIDWARKNGFYIFLITGRHEKERAATIINLHRQNLGFDGLYLRAEDDKRPLMEDYKSEIRKNIEDMGFVVVECIGDQYSDLVGGHALDCEKLPNNMYFVK